MRKLPKHVPKNFKTKKKSPSDLPDPNLYVIKNTIGEPDKWKVEELVKQYDSEFAPYGTVERMEYKVNKLENLFALLLLSLPKEHRDKFVADHLIPIGHSL